MCAQIPNNTHKHGQVLRRSDGCFHHGHHVLMGNHLLTNNTDTCHTQFGQLEEECGTPTGGAV